MSKINIEQIKKYLKSTQELLPLVSDYIRKNGKLPEGITVKELDSDILSKILEIDDEFFDNLKTSELTHEVWEKMLILKPEEYWDIAPEEITKSKNFVLNSIRYNQICMKYFNDEQTLMLINILIDKKRELAVEEFINKYATKDIIDVIARCQGPDLLTELYGNEIFDRKIGNYIFKKSICKKSSVIIDKELLLKEPKLYYEEVYKKGISNIQYFPEQYQRRELWLDAVIKKPNLFKVLPNKYLTKDFCETIFKGNVKIIKYIPKDFFTQRMCDSAYNQSIQYISYFPEKFITDSMIQSTIDKKGDINYIISIAEKRGLMNSQNFKKILEYSFKYLEKINKEYYDREYIEVLLKSGLWPTVLMYMDITYFDYDLLYKCAVDSMKILKRLLPHEHIRKLMDEKIVNIYLSSDYIILDHINDKLLTNDVLRVALEKNNDALSTLPEERRTTERYKIAAEYGYCDSNAPMFIKNQFNGNQLKKSIYRK